MGKERIINWQAEKLEWGTLGTMLGTRWWVHRVCAVTMKSELKCPADLCKYINGVHIWARAIDLEDVCEERMTVAIGVDGFPVGLHRGWETVS